MNRLDDSPIFWTIGALIAGGILVARIFGVLQ